MNHFLNRLKGLASLFCVFFALSAFAQQPVLKCWDFEEACSNPDDAFHLFCIADAQSASGTPDNTSSALGVTAFSGVKYAHMYAKKCFVEGNSPFHTEGITLNYNFTAGVPVKISFAVRSTGAAPTETKVVLVNSLPNYGGFGGSAGCLNMLDTLPNLPPISETITTLPASAIPNNGWKVITLTWTPQRNFNQIWFRPKATTQNPTGAIDTHLYLDRVCIEGNCPALSYTVSTCRYPETNQVVVSLNGSTVHPADWSLSTAPGCVPSIGNPVNIQWLANNSSFLLPYNSGCYTLIGYAAANPGCYPQQFAFSINTNGENVPLCSGPCDDWHNSMTIKFCQEARFEAIPDAYFPSGTQFLFELDGLTVQNGFNAMFSAPLSGAGSISPGWHEMCVTVSQFGCPPVEKCYEFFVDCFEGPGIDREEEGNETTKATGRAFLISNPSSGAIWMSTTFENCIARLYSIQGALVKTFALNGADRLDVAELPTGQYVLAIQSPDGVISKQVYIQN